MNNQNNVQNTVESNQNTVENNQIHDFTIEKSFERKTYCESESDSDTYTVSESETDNDDIVSDTIVGWLWARVVSPWAKGGFSAVRVRVKPWARHQQWQWFQRRESESEIDKGFVRETSREGDEWTAISVKKIINRTIQRWFFQKPMLTNLTKSH